MKGPARTVALYGFLGIGNLGNEGSMKVVLDHLRTAHPNLELTCLSGNPAAVAAEHGLAGTTLMTFPRSGGRLPSPVRKLLGRLWDIPRTFRLVGRSDVIVVPGMGVFEETLGTRPWGLPYWMFLMALSARIRRRRVAFISVGAELPTNRLTRWLFRRTLSMATYRSFRDELSAVAAHQLGGARTSGPLLPDLAFALPVPSDIPVRPGHVALGVMAYYGRDDDPIRGAHVRQTYVEALTDFIGRLLDSQRTVTLLVGDRVDHDVAQQIVDAVRRSRPQAAPGTLTVSTADDLAELMAEMAAAEVVIGSRFHNVLSALRLAKPTVSIAYAAKNTELMTQFGLGAFCQTIEGLDVNLLCAQVDEVVRQHSERAPSMHVILDHYADQLDEQFDELSATLLRLTSAVQEVSVP